MITIGLHDAYCCIPEFTFVNYIVKAMLFMRHATISAGRAIGQCFSVATCLAFLFVRFNNWNETGQNTDNIFSRER